MTVIVEPVEPVDPAEPGASAGEQSRLRADALQEQLASALSRIRGRGLGGGLDVERRMALAGGFLLTAGAVLVLLGWYGAAHTSRLYLQIPYLISGGVLGVVVALAGGFVYFGSWLTRLVGEQRQQREAAAAHVAELNATLVRIEALLEAGLQPDRTS